MLADMIKDNRQIVDRIKTENITIMIDILKDHKVEFHIIHTFNRYLKVYLQLLFWTCTMPYFIVIINLIFHQNTCVTIEHI